MPAVKVLFSTVVRGASEASGEIVRLDWETKRVEAVRVLRRADAASDPNPRGGKRGARGIAVVDGEVIVAEYDSLGVYDPMLERRRDLSHPMMSGVHELHAPDPGTLWLSSTNIDAAVELDLASGEPRRVLWPRESPALQGALGLVPSDVDPSADHRARALSLRHKEDPHHLHLNAVATLDGQPHALLSKVGAVVNLEREEVLLEDHGTLGEGDRGLQGTHNLLFDERDGSAFVNQTYQRNVRVYDVERRKLRAAIDLLRFPWVQRMARRHDRRYWLKRRIRRRLGKGSPNKPLFLRGMDRTGRLLFVGVSPASILCIDLEADRMVDVYQHSTDLRACVHGLKVLPD